MEFKLKRPPVKEESIYKTLFYFEPTIEQLVD